MTEEIASEVSTFQFAQTYSKLKHRRAADSTAPPPTQKNMGNTTSTTDTTNNPSNITNNSHLTAKTKWSEIKPDLNSGDLIFFKNAKPSSISSLSDEWTSANVVVKFSKENLICLINVAQNLLEPTTMLHQDYVLESGSVRIIDVDDKMRYQSAPGELTYSEICIHKISNLELDTHQAELLGAWLKDVVGSHKRHKTLGPTLKTNIQKSKELVIDASELYSISLAAEFYRAIGVFPNNIDLNQFDSPYALLTELETCHIAFERPIMLEVDPSHQPKSWDETILSHGDYGRHLSHSEMIEAQDTMEWKTEIPARATEAFQMAKNIRDRALETKDEGEANQLKARARNLFEVAKMNEYYYATNHPTDKQKFAEINENLQMLSD